MNGQIKPLQTIYKGYNFRSRAEARWAVFFDHIGAKYNYEMEGYDLGQGLNYLPDFYLPDFEGQGAYFEVKVGGKPTRQEILKAEKLARLTKKKVFVLNGVPDFKYYLCCDPTQDDWYSVLFCGGDGNYFHWGGYYTDAIGSKIDDFFNFPYEDIFWDKYVDAVEASRGQRFGINFHKHKIK